MPELIRLVVVKNGREWPGCRMLDPGTRIASRWYDSDCKCYVVELAVDVVTAQRACLWAAERAVPAAADVRGTEAGHGSVAGPPPERSSLPDLLRHVELFDTGVRSLDRPVLLSSRGGGRRSKPTIPALGGRQ